MRCNYCNLDLSTVVHTRLVVPPELENKKLSKTDLRDPQVKVLSSSPKLECLNAKCPSHSVKNVASSTGTKTLFIKRKVYHAGCS